MALGKVVNMSSTEYTGSGKVPTPYNSGDAFKLVEGSDSNGEYVASSVGTCAHTPPPTDGGQAVLAGALGGAR